MSLLEDLQILADHLSPSDVVAGERIVGALIKVLEHEGLKVPPVGELLPEDHPSQISPPAPAAPAEQSSTRLDRIEALLGQLLGHSSSEPAQAGPETSAPSSEPADAPELDRP